MLEKRREALLQILDMRNANIKDLHASNITDDTDFISASMQGQLDSLMIEKYALELEEVEKSLEKIAHNVYGICEMCDEQIDIERLKAKPYARYCIDCREIYEKAEKCK